MNQTVNPLIVFGIPFTICFFLVCYAIRDFGMRNLLGALANVIRQKEVIAIGLFIAMIVLLVAIAIIESPRSSSSGGGCGGGIVAGDNYPDSSYDSNRCAQNRVYVGNGTR